MSIAFAIRQCATSIAHNNYHSQKEENQGKPRKETYAWVKLHLCSVPTRALTVDARVPRHGCHGYRRSCQRRGGVDGKWVSERVFLK